MGRVLRTIAFVATTSVSAGAYAKEALNLPQMHEAVRKATSQFVKTHSDEGVYGFTISRGEEEGANVRVYFKGGSGYAQYYCHVHEHDGDTAKIDCHDLD